MGPQLTRIDELTEQLRRRRNRDQEFALASARLAAFDELDEAIGEGDWPPTSGDPQLELGDGLPVADLADLDVDVLSAAIGHYGSLHLPGMLPPDAVSSLVDMIDRSFDARTAYGPLRRPHSDDERSCDFDPLPVDPERAALLGRQWVSDGGGVLIGDAPHALFEVLDQYERIGLKRVIEGYLGGRPVLSANKCTLRRVPVDAIGGWHQDGAFLGSGIRALNVWLALTDCGVDAPGLDFLPRRFDEIVETGTGGSLFDWAVGPEVIADLAGDTPPMRPTFRAGDALLFDDLFLHQTATEPTMTIERYAIEMWFFASSAYPKGQVPLVW